MPKFKPTKEQRKLNNEPTCSKPEYHNDLNLNVVIVESKADKLQWLLFTTKDISSQKDALSILDAYKKRWLIERFHFTLKSGLKVEQMSYSHAISLQKLITIYSVAAIQILRLTMVARINPDRVCTTIVEDDDWKPLFMTIKKTKTLPNQPPTINEYVQMLAILGGYLTWQKQNPPGLVVLWRGIERLNQIKKNYPLFVRAVPLNTGQLSLPQNTQTTPTSI